MRVQECIVNMRESYLHCPPHSVPILPLKTVHTLRLRMKHQRYTNEAAQAADGDSCSSHYAAPLSWLGRLRSPPPPVLRTQTSTHTPFSSWPPPGVESGAQLTKPHPRGYLRFPVRGHKPRPPNNRDIPGSLGSRNTGRKSITIFQMKMLFAYKRDT